MPQSYREFLKRFGSAEPAPPVSAEANFEVHWPPGTTLEDIESINRKIEAFNDWIMESSRGVIKMENMIWNIRQEYQQELNSYLGILFAEGYDVQFSQFNPYGELRICMMNGGNTLSVGVNGDNRYNPEFIYKKVESMQTLLDLIREENP